MGKMNPGLLFTGIVCLVGITACATSAGLLRDRMAELADKDEIVIVVYGDELSGGEESFFLANTYASMLKPRLIELWGKRISMINSSVENESFRLASRRLEEDILAFRPDIVFVMLGRIDAFTTNLTISVYKQHVEKFLGELKHEGKFVVILTTPGLQSFTDASDDELSGFEEYVQASRSAAHLYRYPIIDIASKMNYLMKRDPDAYIALFSDNSHLSEKGKQFIADLIYDAFAEATFAP